MKIDWRSNDWQTWALVGALVLITAVLGVWAWQNDRKLWALWAGVPYFKPGSDEFKALFRQAAAVAKVPAAWADSDELAKVVQKESGGWVGRPNYLYNRVLGKGYSAGTNAAAWPGLWSDIRRGIWLAVDKPKGFTSRAIGLGQLQPDNVKKYYPSGFRGVGVPLEEAVGVLRYMRDRYGSPEAAWTHEQQKGWW